MSLVRHRQSFAVGSYNFTAWIGILAHENTRPWEFPPGTKAIRYYLPDMGNPGDRGRGPAGGIDEALFDQILAAFRLAG